MMPNTREANIVKQLTRLERIEWIANEVRPKRPGTVSSVAHCVPPIFPAYAKLFHSLYEDIAVKDDNLTWQEDARSAVAPDLGTSAIPIAKKSQEIVDRSTLVYGEGAPHSRPVRIRWACLAKRLGVRFVPTLSSHSFTRQFPGGSWPRYLIGPREGSLDGTDRDALASLLRQHTHVDHCFFHVWLLATLEWKEDLLFEGNLDDVSLFPDEVPGVRLTPTHWFPEDRGWFVCTDYDLTFTLIGGSEALIGDLVSSCDLECVRVTTETRVDWDADLATRVQ